MQRTALLLSIASSLSFACGGPMDEPDAATGDAGECAGLADATPCSAGICVRGACVATRCGDGVIDPANGEACDDANEMAFDGCDPGCTTTCAADADCGDGNDCNGTETCAPNELGRVCIPAPEPVPNGAACQLTPPASGMCREGVCVSTDCGNGAVDTGEDCDDGNTTANDGCEIDCTFSCEDDPECNTPEALGAHASAGACTGGRCAFTCTDGYVDCTGAPGCETDPATDTANCGVCGVACETGGVCIAGTCDGDIGVGVRHSCARRGGSVWCWGEGTNGELGDGNMTNSSVPVQVTGITDAVELQVGGQSACVRTTADLVYCWGLAVTANTDGTPANAATPTMIAGLTDVAEISANDGHICARQSSGTVQCWGYNGYGQLGDNTRTNRYTPAPVLGLTDAVELAIGSNHSCARLSSGGVVCWGDNGYGQLGDTTFFVRNTPVPVSGISGALEISAGREHTCARLASSVVCWGSAGSGELGDGGARTDRPTPGPVVAGLVDAVELSLGDSYSCARRAGGSVVCWGLNDSGQLGDGTIMERYLTTPVVGLTDALEISAHYSHTCARLASGTLCWGWNALGQLGDGTTADHLTPAPVIYP